MSDKKKRALDDALNEIAETPVRMSTLDLRRLYVREDTEPGTPVPQTRVVQEPTVVPLPTLVQEPTVVLAATEPLSGTRVVVQPTLVPETGVDIKSHYAKVPIAFIDDLCSVLEPFEQLMYLQLVRLSWGHKRTTCKISFPRLAERAKISDSAARRAVRALVKRGLVEKVGTDVESPNRQERGITFRVHLPAGTPVQETTPVRQTRVVPQTTVGQGTPMKERSKETHETAPAAPAPTSPVMDKYEIRKRAARIYEARRAEGRVTHDEVIAELRAWARGEGIALGEATIEEATRGMGA